MLIGTQRSARRRGITVRLAAPRPQAAKLLRITGLDQSFTICATLDEALPAPAHWWSSSSPTDLSPSTGVGIQREAVIACGPMPFTGMPV